MALQKIRRKDKAVSEEECFALLRRAEYGILATVGPEGFPYAVPLSFFYSNGKLYFHSALAGHKVDNLRAFGHCCFTVVGATQPVYDKGFDTYYESVVAFGTAVEVTDREEKETALFALARKYLPEHLEKAEKDIQDAFARTAVYSILITSMTGKAKRKSKN